MITFDSVKLHRNGNSRRIDEVHLATRHPLFPIPQCAYISRIPFDTRGVMISLFYERGIRHAMSIPGVYERPDSFLSTNPERVEKKYNMAWKNSGK
ncbi:MAG: hypothetical protein ACTSUE_21600 [Promethearchaeota archaeon]